MGVYTVSIRGFLEFSFGQKFSRFAMGLDFDVPHGNRTHHMEVGVSVFLVCCW